MCFPDLTMLHSHKMDWKARSFVTFDGEICCVMLARLTRLGMMHGSARSVVIVFKLGIHEPPIVGR